MTVEDRLAQMGIILPPPPAGVGSYVTWVRTGNLIYTSGQLPWKQGVMQYPGRVGVDVSVEDARQAARLAAINGIAQLNAATGGDLEKVERIVRLDGSVHCGEGFRDHPKVLDGASDLLVEVFKERGVHTRTAIGVRDMPLNACVQISFIVEVESIISTT